ncbi:MAG: ribosome maturation factor RimP [Deltaproteobacteria bacterium]|nr:ribosome maturation factor RimP [Deltaproteobacteria bacterium]
MAFSGEIETMALKVLDRYTCDLVQGTFQREKAGLVLRLLIERRDSDPDKGSGVDLELCSSINRDLGTELEVEEVINRPYTLEVSSPGIERPLILPRDFTRFSGRSIALRTTRPINGRRRFMGRLEGLGNKGVMLTTRSGKSVTIPSELVKKANLVYEPKGSQTNVGD